MTPQQHLATREFFGIKLGLETMGHLVEALGHPHADFTSVIVAGTNGKGSVTAMTSRALHAAGVRVGRYTSPHLVHLRERFAIDDVDVDDDRLDAALQAVFDAESRLLDRGTLTGAATYFELTTAAALVLFRDAGVDVAVLEVGLGGRHDATNIVAAPWAAITSIGLDHQAQLGDTLAAIAAEKAGVVMPGATVVSGVTNAEARAVIVERCRRHAARLVEPATDSRLTTRTEGGDTWATIETPVRTYGPLRLALRGAHQAENARVAVRLLECLEAAGIGGGSGAITSGLTDARWPGRIERQTTGTGVSVVLDGAHNPDGAAALAAWLESSAIGPVTLVTACMRDKDVVGLVAPLLPHVRRVIATTLPFPRALAATSLADVVQSLAPNLPIATADTPAAALELASEDGATVLVAGSLFLVGATRAWLESTTGPGDLA